MKRARFPLAAAVACAVLAGCHGTRPAAPGLPATVDFGAERPAMADGPGDRLAILHETRDGRVRITETEDGRAWSGGEPAALAGAFAARAAFDGAGGLHVSFGRPDLGEVRYALRRGGVWTSESVAAASPASLSEIAVGADGEPRIAYWEDDHDVGFAARTGDGWAVETADDLEPPDHLLTEDRPHLVLDGGGRAGVAYLTASRTAGGAAPSALRLASRTAEGGWSVRRVAALGVAGQIVGFEADPGGGAPHLAFVETDAFGRTALRYGRVSLATGAFGERFAERADAAGAPERHGARLFVRPDGAPFLGYSTPQGGLEVAVLEAGDWRPLHAISSPGAALHHAAIGFVADGGLRVAFGRFADDALLVSAPR